MAKLTDRQRKRIIAEYAIGGISQRQLAEKYHVSQNTIAKLLSSEKSVQKLSDKKEENTRSMLEFLDEQKSAAQSLMQKLLKASEEDIENASLRDKMGALKILSEVFTTRKDELVGDNNIQITLSIEDMSGGEDAD